MAVKGGEPSCESLLEEFSGLLERLKACGDDAIDDNHPLVVPYCETLEAIFRNGLKQPNSWFGWSKKDYWTWIEKLQEYYFNPKQNPLFSQLVDEISQSRNILSLQARGRCFLRAALTFKLISVPIEHLVKSAKVTSYWYSSDSVIGSAEHRERFMELLFQSTNIKFDFDYKKASFLNETWVIPVYCTYQLPPVRTLDIALLTVDKRPVIIGIEKDCLAEKAGVEVYDILVELCREPIHLIPPGKLQGYLAKHSQDYSELTVVKKYLLDGTPFPPVFRRELMHAYQMSKSRTANVWFPESLKQPEHLPIIRTVGESTEYSLAYLGKQEILASEITQSLVDSSIADVLSSGSKPEEVVLSLGEEFIHISLARTHILECRYHHLLKSSQSSTHHSCLVLIVSETSSQDSQLHLTCHVCEAPTIELAQCICTQIDQDFARSMLIRPGTCNK